MKKEKKKLFTFWTLPFKKYHLHEKVQYNVSQWKNYGIFGVTPPEKRWMQNYWIKFPKLCAGTELSCDFSGYAFLEDMSYICINLNKYNFIMTAEH